MHACQVTLAASKKPRTPQRCWHAVPPAAPVFSTPRTPRLCWQAAPHGAAASSAPQCSALPASCVTCSSRFQYISHSRPRMYARISRLTADREVSVWYSLPASCSTCGHSSHGKQWGGQNLVQLAHLFLHLCGRGLRGRPCCGDE